MFNPRPYVTDVQTKIVIPARLANFIECRLHDFGIECRIYNRYQLPLVDTEYLPSRETVDEITKRSYTTDEAPYHEGALIVSHVDETGIAGLVHDRKRQEFFFEELKQLEHRGL